MGAPNQVLDPNLLALVEQCALGQADPGLPVHVLLGLADAPVTVARRLLSDSGLTLHSDIGTVLTGVIPLKDVPRLAQVPGVLRIESSTPMFRESPEEPGALPYG
jgi:hypothetical protein